MAQKYLALYSNGDLNTCAQIHAWHDAAHCTVEYLPYYSMFVWVSVGIEPGLEPINPKECYDIDLDNLPDGYDDYKLHHTWLTVAGDFARAEERHFTANMKGGNP